MLETLDLVKIGNQVGLFGLNAEFWNQSPAGSGTLMAVHLLSHPQFFTGSFLLKERVGKI